MKVLWFIIILFLAITLLYGMVSADFVAPERPSFDVSSGGDTAHQHWTLTGIAPILNGYAGIQWTHARDTAETTSNHLKARVEVSKHWNWLGIHAYGRYGKRSVMAQDRLLQGGLALDLKLVDTDDIGVNLGVGSYVEHETLEAEYQAVMENASVAVAPRGHLNLRWRFVVIQTELLLSQDLKSYQVRAYPEVEIPFAKLFFIEQLYLVASGGVEYNSKTKHVDIEPLQWHWAHALRWRF